MTSTSTAAPDGSAADADGRTGVDPLDKGFDEQLARTVDNPGKKGQPGVGGDETDDLDDTGHRVEVTLISYLMAACALNAIAAIKSEIGDLDAVTRVVKVVGFVASDPGFTGQPGVINGASELLVKAFGDKGIHARSAVGVAALPLDAPVEVEVIVSVAR